MQIYIYDYMYIYIPFSRVINSYFKYLYKGTFTQTIQDLSDKFDYTSDENQDKEPNQE